MHQRLEIVCMVYTRPDIYHAVKQEGSVAFSLTPAKNIGQHISSWEENEEPSSQATSQDPNEEGRETYLASDRGKKKRLASIIIKEGDKEIIP